MEFTPDGIPIIDFSPVINFESKRSLQVVAKHAATAIETCDCFFITNHGMDTELIDSSFSDLKTYFYQSPDYKTTHSIPGHHRGYVPFQTENVNAFMGRSGFPNDPIERFVIGPPFRCDPPAPENVWPDVPTTFSMNLEAYYLSTRQLANSVMRILSLAVKAPNEEYFYENCHRGQHRMKANFYPGIQKPMQVDRFAEHTDGTIFTILSNYKSSKSLLIKKMNGEWAYADSANPYSVLILLGDAMQRMTNDKWKATLHKVTWPQDNDQIPDRLSTAFFVHMNLDAMVECVESCLQSAEKPKYHPVPYSQFVIDNVHNRITYIYENQ